MQPDHATYALPYCPRPNREEAAHSWLTRVGQSYGLTADRLVGQLLREHHGTFCLERAFVAPHVHALSKATRIPRRTLRRLQGAPIDWILQDRRYCNVCICCIDADVLAGKRSFLRLAWRHAWKTHCATHGTRLLRTELKILGDIDVPNASAEYHRLRTISTTLESRLDQSLSSSLRVLAITRSIERIETAIGRAFNGDDPDSRVWGFISASDFLVVVQDVTTWALSTFECFPARPEAENLPNGVRSAADFYFTMMPAACHRSPPDRPCAPCAKQRSQDFEPQHCGWRKRCWLNRRPTPASKPSIRPPVSGGCSNVKPRPVSIGFSSK